MRASLLLIAATTTGCLHWVPASLPPAEVLASRQQPHDMIRLLLDDSSRVVLHDHVLRRDSVIGYLKSAREPGARAPAVVPRGVPLAAVRTVHLRRVDPVRTAILAAGVVGSVAFAIAMRDFSCCRIAIPCGLFGEPCPARAALR